MDSTENKIALQITNLKEIFKIPQEQMFQAQKLTFSLGKVYSEQGDFSDALNRVEDFKNLKNLYIDYSSVKSQIKELINLKEFVQQLNNLTKLKFNFVLSKFLTKESILEVILCLQNKVHLKNVGLYLYRVQQLNDEHITQICYFISQIKDLKSLGLQLGQNDEISDLSLSQISNCLLNHLNLQKLTLSFYDFKKIQRFEGFPQTLAKLTNLRNLNLTFFDCSILEQKELISINKSISNALLLEYLYLEFSQCFNMTQEAVNELANSLKNFQNLKCFYLDLSQNESIRDLRSLGQSLFQLISLNKVCLNLASLCQLEIGPFGSLISHNQCIQIFEIKLYDCYNLSDLYLQLFLRDLSFLSNLSQLTICFFYLNSQTKFFMDELSQVIKAKTKLIKIQVNSFLEDGMLKFIQTLSQLKSLNSFSLISQNKQKFLNKIYKIKRLVLFSDDF